MSYRTSKKHEQNKSSMLYFKSPSLSTKYTKEMRNDNTILWNFETGQGKNGSWIDGITKGFQIKGFWTFWASKLLVYPIRFPFSLWSNKVKVVNDNGLEWNILIACKFEVTETEYHFLVNVCIVHIKRNILEKVVFLFYGNIFNCLYITEIVKWLFKMNQMTQESLHKNHLGNVI